MKSWNSFVESPVTTREILLQYYPTYLPDINSILWPLFALISVVFFCSRMAKTPNSSPCFQWIQFYAHKPSILMGAGVIALFLYLGNHYFCLRRTGSKLDFMNHRTSTSQHRVRTTHMFISPDTKVYINSYNTLDTTANDLRFRNLSGQQPRKDCHG